MDTDIDMHILLPRFLESLEDEKATEVANNKGQSQSVVVNKRADTPIRRSLDIAEHLRAASAFHAISTSQPSSPARTDTSIRSMRQALIDSVTVDIPRAVLQKFRALSESDAETVAGTSSCSPPRLPPDVVVRDFAPVTLSSYPPPKLSFLTPIQLGLRTCTSESLYPASRIVPVPATGLAKLKGTLERVSIDSKLPPDLSPQHVGKHPRPYTLPPAPDLAKILNPTLVKAIVSSTYQSLIPKDTRCFCSLVLHEIQRRASDMRLDVDGPRSHAELQSQLRNLLSEKEVVAEKLLGLYGDALKLHAHARLNARPMRHDSWAEIIGMMMEDVFMLGRHPVFDELEAAERERDGMQAEVQATQKRGGGKDVGGGKRAVLRRKVKKLGVFRYKGKRRVFRSKGRRWDFTS